MNNNDIDALFNKHIDLVAPDAFINRYMDLVAPRRVMYVFYFSGGFILCKRFEWGQMSQRYVLLTDNKKKLIASLRADLITGAYFTIEGNHVSELYKRREI